VKAKQTSKRPKPSRRKAVATKAVTVEERNNMFAFWTENGRNIVATAKKFAPRSRKLIYKIKKEDDWDNRAAGIDHKVKASVDRKITARVIANVELVDACLKREVQACLQKPIKKVAGSPQNIVLMANFVEEARGNLPREPGESAVPEQVAKALKLLEELEPADIKKLADEIAKTRKSLEGNEQ